jgi:hypothetical protein
LRGDLAVTYVEACTLLHVASGVPVAVAEAAYRTLSKRAHPDVGGDTRGMARLTEAVETIRHADHVEPSAARTCHGPVSDIRLPWGKHRGALLSEIPLGYLAWLASECDDNRIRSAAVGVLHVRTAQLEEVS